MAANIESMFSLRETPWHGEGVVIQEAPTMGDAMKLAGLDWEIDKVPLFADHPTHGKLEYPTTYGLIRSDTGDTLGTCSPQFRPIQNADAFDFLDSLAGEGSIQWETAGALVGSKKVWVLGRLPEDIRIKGDNVAQYCLFYSPTGNNGSAKVKGSDIRVVCQNTISMALRDGRETISIRHDGSLAHRLECAREAIGLKLESGKKLQEAGEYLAGVELSDAKIHDWLNTVFPLQEEPGAGRTRALNGRESIRSLLVAETNQTKATKGTLWGLLNAGIEYVDHESQTRGNSSNLDRIQFGSAVKKRNAMWEASMALA